jgi:hypothetical protein
MIFMLIAGTYAPFALLALRGAVASALLIAVWAGAVAGIVFKLAWIDASKWLIPLVYVLLGWLGAAAVPTMIATLRTGPAALVASGGVLYTAGVDETAAGHRSRCLPGVLGDRVRVRDAGPVAITRYRSATSRAAANRPRATRRSARADPDVGPLRGARRGDGRPRGSRLRSRGSG